MKYLSYLLVLVFVYQLNGCAVYDPERGVFVSSSVQTIKLDLPSELDTIYVSKFGFPSKLLTDTQSTTYASGGAFIPISHTYGFDKVDKEYLHQSLVSSLVKSKVKVVSLEETQTRLNINFIQLGMVDAGFSGSVLVLTAKVKFTKNGKVVEKLVDVKGEANMTIASSKDQAIRQFLKEVSTVIKSV
jgi:hypothetical protein